MDDKTIADAYVYLLGRALVIRQEQIDSAGPGFAYNQVKYNPLGSADFVNPNFDVAYLEGWIAVDGDTPVILEVPEVRGRYYTAQILDEWGEVIANINERNFPSKPWGRFALVQPGAAPVVPAGASRIVLHSNKAKLLARVELKGDPEGALDLQRRFSLTPRGTPAIASPPDLPMFDNDSLIGVELFDDVETLFASALDVSPIAAAMQQCARAVAAHVAAGAVAREEVDTLIRGTIVAGFKDYVFTKSAPYRNHWVGGGRTGNYGSNYWMRTTVNFAGIWANTTDEVIYFTAIRDATGKPLDGAGNYVIHFPADQLPQTMVNAYWSVILVDASDFRVVANPLHRFNFNSNSPLAREPDGSLKIAIGPRPVPDIADSNWLPSPDGKAFSLTFRAYVPKNVVKRQQWSPPPVTPIDRPGLSTIALESAGTEQV